MKTRNDIVDELAREKVVETMCVNIARTSIKNQSLEDLAQMMYLILLTYDEGKIVAMYESGELRFFIASVLQNQYNSRNSSYYRNHREFGEHIDESEDMTKL